MATIVVNRHTGEPYDVYIGRPSKWGSRFVIGRDGSRMEVIRRYRGWLLTRPDLIRAARIELRGKVLGCWCKPEPCHGDILAKFADGEEESCVRS